MNANKYYPQLQCVVCVHYHRQQSIIHGDAAVFDCQYEREHMFEPISCPCISGGHDLRDMVPKHKAVFLALHYNVKQSHFFSVYYMKRTKGLCLEI